MQRNTWKTIALALAALLAAGNTAETAQHEILETAGIEGGIIVHLGCGDGSLAEQLAAGDRYLVQGLDTNPATVTAARKRLLDAGRYGQVTVDRWNGRHLPYIDNFVNLIVAEDSANATTEELMRALTPNGVLLEKRASKWEKTVKTRPAAMDDWTHYFHGPDGNPTSEDTLVAPPTRLQWLGGPAWSRHHDHMASMSALVSANGRLFYIIDEGSRASIQLPAHWRLVARDAFNGAILWKREIPDWASKDFGLKSGPAHLLRRVVAIGDRVYVTLGIDAPASILDAATGQTRTTCEGTKFARELVVAEDTALVVLDRQKSRLPDFRRVGTYVWHNTRASNTQWGWHGAARTIAACDATSGKRLWTHDSPVAPCSLAADATSVVFHDGTKLVCLERRSGNVRWEAEETPLSLPVQSNTGPRVLICRDRVLLGGIGRKMSGWSLKDGKKVWEQAQKPSGHLSLRDLFVSDGLTWTAAIAGSKDDGVWIGYDPVTGTKKREFPPDVTLDWFHHRCYPAKATGRFIVMGRNGTEFVDLKTERMTPNNWVRGGCIYGVMPCNGMTYAAMDACGCQLEAKLSGFKALASWPIPEPDPDARLERGPAYNTKPQIPRLTSADWPTYRHDAARSGTGANALKTGGRSWETKLGGQLSAPTVAYGRLFVAARDRHTVYALDASSGKTMWSYTTGGPTDTPPTCWNGRVIFGAADGYIYALLAESGRLAWRFRAAPVDQRIMAWERIESAWPVHGSVLVHEPQPGRAVIYCTAGRSIYLDGGIRFIRLDALTGELLGEVAWNAKDPLSGKGMHDAYQKKTPGNTMPVGLSDVLSCDGKHIWMRSQKIDFDGKRSELTVLDAAQQPADDAHLFSQVGFTDDSYFFRTYWTYGRRMTGGYGGWFQAGRYVPSGRILCFDDDAVYGYGRKPAYMVNSSVIEYQLFAANKAVTTENIAHVDAAGRTISRRRPDRNANSSDWRLRWFFPSNDLTATRFGWTVDQPPVFARAMCVAGDTLCVAGPADLVDERYAYRNPDDPDVLTLLEQQEEAYAGKRGGRLWLVDKRSGKPLARRALDTVPVFDGMATANGCLYMCTVDGRVLSLSRDGIEALPSLENQPAQTKWDKPEDPKYLLALPESKEKDFAVVKGCKVFASKLGYRLRAGGKDKLGIALQKLDRPLAGKVTLRTTIRAVPTQAGLRKNGCLVFGESAREADLVKCGVLLQPQKASIVQGPYKGPRKGTATAQIDAPDKKGLEAVVTVDLDARTVTYLANGVKLEAELKTPLRSITHVGYLIDSALVDVAPIKIKQ